MPNSLKTRAGIESVSDNGAFSVLCKVPDAIRRNIEVSHSGCWLWRGLQFTTGYGAFKFEGKTWKAHRLLWTLLNGPIPPRIHCLHHCDTPLCVNVIDTEHHVFLGTNRDNHQDKASKGRHWQQKKTHCPKGHPYTPENTYTPPSGGRHCCICKGMPPRTLSTKAVHP
jgi:hypothetical protein